MLYHVAHAAGGSQDGQEVQSGGGCRGGQAAHQAGGRLITSYAV